MASLICGSVLSSPAWSRLAAVTAALTAVVTVVCAVVTARAPGSGGRRIPVAAPGPAASVRYQDRTRRAGPQPDLPGRSRYSRRGYWLSRPAAANDKPACGFVVVRLGAVQAGIGERRDLPAQPDQAPVPGQQAGVRFLAGLGPVQHGPLECRRILGIGHFGRVPAETGELEAPSRADRLAQFRIGMAGEVLEGSAGTPLLALEEQ